MLTIDPNTTGVELPSLELLQKFDVPAPRYTSYPTADRFQKTFTAADYEMALKECDTDKPLSLYVHIPFCNDICFYCGCNKQVTRDHTKSGEYLDVLGREIELVKERITGNTTVSQLHFGGGSPTFLNNEEIERVMALITEHFPLEKGGEFSMEVDPRTCPPDKVQTLAKVGLNRMSCGVQDFNPEVQKAVNRIQPFEMTKETMQAAREAGFHSINMDLIYGLPKQTRKSFEKTLDQVLELSPDRIALYHYAHLPHIFPPQRRILDADLPPTVEKVHIMMDAITRLTQNGYRYIGMDHFAKVTDELAIAQKEGKLQRNFQGYSTRPDCDMVALGVSAISNVHHCYACNPRDLPSYYEAIRAGRLATNRGYKLSEEDQLRHAVIMTIMCQFKLEKATIESRFGIHFDETFAYELRKLRNYEKVGLVQLTPEAIIVSPKGKIFVRAVAMQFDRYLRESDRAGGYSKIA